MALTLTKISAHTAGNKRHRVYDVTFDSSYPTGGESLTAADVNLRKIEELIVHGPSTATRGGTSGAFPSYDYTNAKLQLFWGNAGTASVAPEVTNTTDVSTQICRITAIGY